MCDLVSTDWLINNINNPQIVILDTRNTSIYWKKYIKHSHKLSIDRLIKPNKYGSHLVIGANEANTIFSSFGIDNKKTVVICGEYMDPTMMRIAWTFLYFGHKKIKLLNVGINSLHDENILSSERIPLHKSLFHSNINHNVRITTDELKNKLNDIILLDARTSSEYHSSHLPNSISLPFTIGLSNNNSFQNLTTLIDIFKKNKLNTQDEIVCYCTYGHRASSLFFQLSLSGYANVKLYDGSIVDWNGSNLPLE